MRPPGTRRPTGGKVALCRVGRILDGKLHCRRSRGERSVKRPQRKTIAILLAAGIVGGALAAGCARKDARQEVVATVNGEDIKVLDLRAWMGDSIGTIEMTYIPAEKKKKALDHLIVGWLMAQDARSRGMDNTPEFRESFQRSEHRVRVNGLFRKEIGAKLKNDGEAVKAEIARIQETNKKISAEGAAQIASRRVYERQVLKIREELIATAKKETGAAVNQVTMGNIGKGEDVPDNAVIASVGEEKILYGDVKKMLEGMSPTGESQGRQDLSKNPEGIAKVVDQEVTLLALSAYARKKGIEGSDVYKMARQEEERNILRGLVAQAAVRKEVTITEKEVENGTAERSREIVRQGKKIPLSTVREQVRASLLNDKHRQALDDYIAELKKKARITIDNAVLSKV
jgi:hypothetical protein